MRAPLRGHRLEYVKAHRDSDHDYDYSVGCQCGWSTFLHRTKRKVAVEAHRDHKDYVIWLAGHCAECGTEINDAGLCEDCSLIEPSTQEIVTGTGLPPGSNSEEVYFDMIRDGYPVGTGVCRYCGYAPGPVCGAYACNIKDNEESD